MTLLLWVDRGAPRDAYTRGLFGPYVLDQTKIYKCPVDPRDGLQSVSMNCCVLGEGYFGGSD
jgi:hypothetical protein